jgi:hypothetical protein
MTHYSSSHVGVGDLSARADAGSERRDYNDEVKKSKLHGATMFMIEKLSTCKPGRVR